MKARYAMMILWLGLGCVPALRAQVAYYNLQRQAWLSQVSTNPVPAAYRFSTLLAGANLVRAEARSPLVTNALQGGSLQMTFATNFPAYTLNGTNLLGGLAEFNAQFPTGNYGLYAEYRPLAVTLSRTYGIGLTNDFPAIAPVFTNVTPLLSLQTTQTFAWPVFSTDTNCYSRFYLLEGSIDTNLLGALITNGVEAITNNLGVLAWVLHLSPIQNQVVVTNINPLLDHLAILEFHNVNPLADNLLGLNEAASVALNATFFFALRLLEQPQSQTVEEGDVVLFNVLAVGARPLAYQWYFNGTNLPHATNLVLLLPAAKMSDAGNYSVVVSNPVGMLTSQVATLTVTRASQPRLFDLRFQPDHTFYFQVMGSGAYTLEASEYLSSWTTIGTLNTPLGTNAFADTNAPRFPTRFYRARQP